MLRKPIGIRRFIVIGRPPLHSRRGGPFIDPEHRQRHYQPAGITLIEVTAALTLMSLLAAVCARCFTTAAARTVETTATAHALQLHLERSRQSAIMTGIPHGLRFNTKSGKVASVTPFLLSSGGPKPISADIPVPEGVALKSNRPDIIFDAEGTTTAGQVIQFKAPSRTWEIRITAVTGTVAVQEL